MFIFLIKLVVNSTMAEIATQVPIKGSKNSRSALGRYSMLLGSPILLRTTKLAPDKNTTIDVVKNRIDMRQLTVLTTNEQVIAIK